ncbi:SRPBCC domain-containing protein [Fulvivirga sp.]|uniref:SRPBCC family protein n=1 Tax=Fulvivirga sp. TaxID=1931237 RepID=UPI0032F086C9
MKFFFTLIIVLLSNLTFGQATSETDTLPSGELMLKQEILINASIEKVWNAYTTTEGWKAWVTPIVEIDFKINGTIKSHYDSTATIGDKGTIVNHVLNYIPYKLITMQAELNENFPEFMIGEEKNLYSIVEFEKLGENQTKLTIYGIGYKNEQQWIDLLKFFIQGNEMSLNKLKNYLE